MVSLQSWLANTQALDTATALGGTEQFRLIQGGVSKTVTATLLAAYLAGASSTIAVGTTVVTGGTSGNIFYNNAGVVGELATTGSGDVVRATSPTLVTPALGTPSALVLTNATGLPVASLVGDTSTALGVGSINLGHASDTTLARVSAGVVSIEGVTILTTATGQPLDADLTSWAAVTRASGFDTFAATPSSANLAALLTDETGTGASVFANTPTLVTPVIGAATGTSLTVTGTLYAYSGTAIPAGGTTGAGVKFSSTSNYGVFFGSGAPTLSAAQGSIYLRSDGTAAAGVYINTNGSTTWGAVGAATSPGGSSGQVQYNNAGAFGGVTGLTLTTGTLSSMAITAGTLNGTVFDITQTFGGTGTYTGISYNITNSGPANVASSFVNYQIAGTSKFKVQLDGSIFLGTASTGVTTGAGIAALSTADVSIYTAATRRFAFSGTQLAFFANSPGIALQSNIAPTITFGASDDVVLTRDAADTLALRRTTNAQTFNAYATYTDASNYSALQFLTANSGTNRVQSIAAGTGGLSVLGLYCNNGGTLSGFTVGASAVTVRIVGNDVWNFNSSGHLLANTDNTYDIGASGATRPRNGYFGGTLQFGTHSAIAAETVTGYITITDAGGTTRKLAVVS